MTRNRFSLGVAATLAALIGDLATLLGFWWMLPDWFRAGASFDALVLRSGPRCVIVAVATGAVLAAISKARRPVREGLAALLGAATIHALGIAATIGSNALGGPLGTTSGAPAKGLEEATLEGLDGLGGTDVATVVVLALALALVGRLRAHAASGFVLRMPAALLGAVALLAGERGDVFERAAVAGAVVTGIAFLLLIRGAPRLLDLAGLHFEEESEAPRGRVRGLLALLVLALAAHFGVNVLARTTFVEHSSASTGTELILRPESPASPGEAKAVVAELEARLATDEVTLALLERLHAGLPAELACVRRDRAKNRWFMRHDPPRGKRLALRFAITTDPTPWRGCATDFIASVELGQVVKVPGKPLAVSEPGDLVKDVIRAMSDRLDARGIFALLVEDWLLRNRPAWALVRFDDARPHTIPERRADLDARIAACEAASSKWLAATNARATESPAR